MGEGGNYGEGGKERERGEGERERERREGDGRNYGEVGKETERGGRNRNDSGNQGSNQKRPLYACFLSQHNEIYMSVFSVITFFNHQNANAEPSESINLVCIELDIQVISSGINNFRVDCTTVWSKKGREVWISVINCQVIIWTNRWWGGWLSLQLKVIEYHFQNIITIKKLAFYLNMPLTYHVVIIIPRILIAFYSCVPRCWCSKKHRTNRRGTIYREKYLFIILIQYMADSVQIIAQPIRLQHLYHYTMPSRLLL